MKRSCLIAFIDLLSIVPLLTLKRPVIRWIVSWPAPNFAAWLNLYSLYLVGLILVLAAAVVIRRWVGQHQVAIYLGFALGMDIQSWFWTAYLIATGVGFRWSVWLHTFSYQLVIIALGLIVLVAFRRPQTVRGFEPVMETESQDGISSSPES